ncbi:MAG: hypothetical protein IJX97_02120 [Clostridia bacterium]|nr:hypothetical protein [Clostridia bacterium]
MKKIRLLLAVILTLTLLLSVGVFSHAEEDEVLRISDDYRSVTLGDATYKLVSVPDAVYLSYDFVSLEEELTEAQSAVIESVAASVKNEVVIYLSVDFFDGGYFSEYYIREDTLPLFDKICSGEGEVYYLDTLDGDRIFFDSSAIPEETVTMPSTEYVRYELLEVCNTYTELDHAFRLKSGGMFLDGEGNCYYLDYLENGSDYFEFMPLMLDEVVLHKITDSEIISALIGGEETERNMSFIHSSSVVWTLLLCIIPLCLAAFCLVKIKRVEPIYRRLFVIAICLAVLTVIIFAILASTVLPYI